MSDKKKLIFVTVAASVGFWYWWNYMRKKEVPPVPPAPPFAPVPPVAPVPPSATYKIGDRVTYVLPRNDKGVCEKAAGGQDLFYKKNRGAWLDGKTLSKRLYQENN